MAGNTDIACVQGKKCTWKEEEPDRWGEEVGQSGSWKEYPRYFYMVGTCPSCGHQTPITVPKIKGLAPADPQVCDCEGDHPHVKAGGLGCGSRGSVPGPATMKRRT